MKRGENMIERFCEFLTNKMKKEMPDMDDERAEVIQYGLQIIIGEIPKMFILLLVSYVLGVFQTMLLTLLIMIPYRNFSGGFHLQTHLGCIISTCVSYCGVALLAKYIVLGQLVKYLLIGFTWVFGMIMIKLYAPADTENVPIISKKDRKKKKIASYLILTIGMLIATFINYPIVTNIFIFGYLVQSCTITRFAYKLTKSQYGHEVYQNV